MSIDQSSLITFEFEPDKKKSINSDMTLLPQFYQVNTLPLQLVSNSLFSALKHYYENQHKVKPN